MARYSPKAPAPRANGSNTTALEAVDFRCATEAVCSMQVYCLSRSKHVICILLPMKALNYMLL